MMPTQAAINAAVAAARQDVENYSEFASMALSDATLTGLVTGALNAAFAAQFPKGASDGSS